MNEQHRHHFCDTVDVVGGMSLLLQGFERDLSQIRAF
jgi:hypothetical protein